MKITSGHPKLSIVIVSYNRKDLLKSTLTSIKEHINPLTHEIIVVDNGSSDGSAEMVSQQFPEALLVKKQKNTGNCEAYNVGFRKACGEYICMMHEDIIVLENSLQKLIDFLDSNPKAGYVGPLNLNLERKPIKTIEKFHTPVYDIIFSYRHLLSNVSGRTLTKIEGRATEPVCVDWMSFSCLLVRGNALAQTGYFPDVLQQWWDDPYIQLKMRRAGWLGYFMPEAKIIHHRGLMNKQIHTASKPTTIELIWIQSKYIYFREFYGKSGLAFVKVNDFFIFTVYLAINFVKFIVASRDVETKYQINRWFQYLVYVFYTGKKPKFRLEDE